MNMLGTEQIVDQAPLSEEAGFRSAAQAEAFAELEDLLFAALETYSNVHRGTGHNSMITTCLYERAREIVLEYLGLMKKGFVVVFCTPQRASELKARLKAGSFKAVSCQEIGLPLGIVALAIEKKALPLGVPSQTGGGTPKMISSGSVIWEDAPQRFEAGTPAVINAVALAGALQVMRRYGPGIFKKARPSAMTARQILYDDRFHALSGRELLFRLRGTKLGRGILVPTSRGPQPFTNLDNAASTPTFLPIWEAVCKALKLPKQEWPKLVSLVRHKCARFFGMSLTGYNLIFVSNATEAINLVTKSLEQERDGDFEPVVLNTLQEHSSNELPWRYAKGVSSVRIPVDDKGFIDIDELSRVLREYNLNGAHGKKRIKIVAVSGASNVLGTCADLKMISQVVHRFGARFLVDAAQLAGHRKIDMRRDEIDYLAFSGHKMYAPFGSGGLIVRKGLLRLDRKRMIEWKISGEENLAGIAALGQAIDLLQRIGMDVVQDEEQKLTRQALIGLASVPGIEIFGLKDPASRMFSQKSGVISFSLKGMPHNFVAEKLAEDGGIGVRNGCFCAHLLVKHLLHIHPLRQVLANAALKIFPGSTQAVLPGLVRISLGLENDQEDIGRLIRTLKKIGGSRVPLVGRVLAWTHNAAPFLPFTDARRQMNDFCETRCRLI